MKNDWKMFFAMIKELHEQYPDMQTWDVRIRDTVHGARLTLSATVVNDAAFQKNLEKLKKTVERDPERFR